MSRLFIELELHGDDGHYDFASERGNSRQVQENKSGSKQITYTRFAVTPSQLRQREINPSLWRTIANWNAEPNKEKLKIRLGAHGTSKSIKVSMYNAALKTSERVDVRRVGHWLAAHGLKHAASDQWTLVCTMATCEAAAAICSAFAGSLADYNIRGAKVTGCPQTIGVHHGQLLVHHKSHQVNTFSLPSRNGDSRILSFWSTDDGTKQTFIS